MKNFSSCGYCHGEEKPCPDARIKWRDPVVKGGGLMRVNLIVFLFFLGIVNVCASGFAQSVTLSFRDKPLIDVLNELKRQSGYELIYNSKYFSGNAKITVSIKNQSLQAALEKCLAGHPFTFDIIDKTIVIKRKPAGTKGKIEFQPQKITVTGKVLDEKGNGLGGVNIKVKETDIKTTTNDQGSFGIEVFEIGASLQFSLVGYQPLEHKVVNGNSISVTLMEATGQLMEVGIVSTGYQQLPKERATGSFVILDNKLLNRRVSTNIIDRLDGVTSGLYFNGSGNLDIAPQIPGDRLGINIRGESTLITAKDPLIVVDNFPYSGEIKNLNPNDIASITILKDAAAASIWGARAGNGVIVITTKKGKLNSGMNFTFNSNVAFLSKPNLNHIQNTLPTSDFIEIERYLFQRGFFEQNLSNKVSHPAISPVVELLDKQRKGLISSGEVEKQLSDLSQIDVRKDFDKYVYQQGVQQQYYLGMNGGTDNLAYSLSVGLDGNKDQIKRNGYNRITVNSFNNYQPLKGLEITFGLNYSNSKSLLNNIQNTYGNYNYAVGGGYTKMLPYSQLADQDGNWLPIVKGFGKDYIDQMRAMGLKDWSYRPLEEIENADISSKLNSMLMRVGAKYSFTKAINAELQYASEIQNLKRPRVQNQNTYFVRNLINRFSQINPVTGTISYKFPDAGIYTENNSELRNQNFRGQLNYNESFKEHNITALAGFEVRESNVDINNLMLYGYDDQFGTSVNNLDFQTFFPVLPSGTARIPQPSNSVGQNLERYISYYTNIAYEYKIRYQLTLSARKDGSNIFGVNTNKKVTPLWSAGLGWIVTNESSFKLPEVFNYLKFRATYGYNGNLRNTSAYLTGLYSNESITGNKSIRIISPPNPDLRWEKVRNVNLGMDFSLLDNRISGTAEYYIKTGMDLLQTTPLAGQTGFPSFVSNAAGTKTRGLDLTFNSVNLKGAFKWNTSFLLSTITDKLITYTPEPTSAIMQANGALTPVVGYPLYSIFSYKWAGIDSQNGDPLGFLNGVPSKDYAAINNNFAPDSVTFNGSSRPKIFGGLRNDFTYKDFSLSFNIVFKLDYYFRRPTTSLNYTDLIGLYQHTDYSKRWQAAGDELSSSVPSLSYPSNSRRNTFYQSSEILVERADHIRLQDIRFGYNMSANLIKKIGFKRLEVFTYLQNLGILWRKNKYDIDPDNPGALSTLVPDIKTPLNWTLGLTADF